MLMYFYRSVALALIAALVVSCGGLPGRKASERSGREVRLRDDLMAMRKAIDLYAADHAKLPKSLDDLVKAGYLRQIPEDPMTKKPDWRLITGEDPNRRGETGIIDIRSSSTERSIEGQPYSEW